MADVEEAIFIALVSILEFSSLLVNALFIFVIQRKTPRDLSSYSRLLLCVACVDLLAACCSFACVLRVQQTGGLVAFIYVGPCKVIGPKLCHLLLCAFPIFHSDLTENAAAIYANMIGQSILLLLVSFAFRLWKLNTGGVNSVSRRFWATIIISIAFNIVSLALELPAFILAASYQVPRFANEAISYLDLTGGIRDNLLPRCSILLTTLTFYVVFMSIFAIRGRLFARIEILMDEKVHKMKRRLPELRTQLTSAAERHNHQMIYRSLTTLMMLPLVYVAGSLIWMLDAAGIVHSRMLQQAITIVCSIFPLASPLINMYYIPPYRRYIKSICARNQQITPGAVSSF